MKTVTAEKALQSYISETLDTLEKEKDVWWLIETMFFQQRILNRSFVQNFKGFCKIFQTLKNSSTSKKVVYLRTTGQL